MAYHVLAIAHFLDWASRARAPSLRRVNQQNSRNKAIIKAMAEPHGMAAIGEPFGVTPIQRHMIPTCEQQPQISRSGAKMQQPMA